MELLLNNDIFLEQHGVLLPVPIEKNTNEPLFGPTTGKGSKQFSLIRQCYNL